MLVLIIVAVAATTAWLVVQHTANTKPNPPKQQSTAANQSGGDTNSTSPPPAENAAQTAERAHRNTRRKDDVYALANGVSEYQSNNSGQLPAQYTNGTFSGGEGSYSTTVHLGYYTNVSLETGQQASVTKDTIRVVSGATCATDGATQPASDRFLAIQYATESAGDKFTPVCFSP